MGWSWRRRGPEVVGRQDDRGAGGERDESERAAVDGHDRVAFAVADVEPAIVAQGHAFVTGLERRKRRGPDG